MKLDIQLFAYSQTILNNQKSTGSSPVAYYTVTAEPNNAARTATTINIKVNVKSSLGSSTSSLTTGPTMGLNAYFKFNGESKTLKLKATDSGWSGTTAHYAATEWSIPLAATATSLPNITFRVERTGSAAGTTDTSKGAWLKETACSNITGIAQGLTAPTITVQSGIPNDIETSFYITTNQTSNIYYQFNNTGNFEKIGDNVVSYEKKINNLSPGTTYTVKFQAKNPADENLVSAIETRTFTTSPNPSFKSGPGNLTLSSGTSDATLYFSNPHGRAITITPSSGIGLAAKTIYGESVTFKLDQSQLYQAIPNTTKGTIVYSYVITTASGSKINGSYSQTYSTSEQNCKPEIDTTKFKYSAEHQSNYSWYTGAGLINNHSTLNVYYEDGLASPKNGAGISSVKFTFAGATKDIGTSSVNYGVTYNYTAPTAGTITVTDTRNYSSTANVNIAFVKYEIPKAWISAAREGGYGESVSISVGGSTSLAGNSLAQYQWSPDFSTWYDCNAQGKATTSISSDESKVLYCAVKDKAGNWSDYSTMSTTARVTVQKGQPLMFIDSKKQGTGINCFPENKGLEVVGKAYFKDGQSVHTVNGNGVSGYWHFVDISTTKAYADQPIRMSVTKRNGAYADLLINTSGGATAGTLNVQGIARAGNMDVYYTCIDNVIALYVAKGQAWDSVAVNKVEVADAEGAGYIFNWKKEHLNSLPSGFLTASRLGWDGNAATASSANYANSAGSASYADSAGSAGQSDKAKETLYENTSGASLRVALTDGSTTGYPNLYNTSGLQIYHKQGTTSSVGRSELVLGTAIGSGNDGCKDGTLRLFTAGTGSNYIARADNGHNNTHWNYLPDKGGTFAMTSDLPQFSSGSTIVTKSSGNITVGSSAYVKYGRVVSMYMSVTASAAIAGGNDIGAVQVTDASLYPADGVGAAFIGYLGGRTIVGSMNSSGTMTVRNSSATQIASGQSIGIRGTYICK